MTKKLEKSLLDPTFRYTPAVDTDIRRTFAKARKRLAEQQAKSATDVIRPLPITQLRKA